MHEGAAAAEYIPKAHSTQLEEDDAPVASRNWPAVQETQLVAPLTSWYLPAAQDEQALALLAEYRPTKQLAQPDDAARPIAPEDVPAGQLEQLVDSVEL